MASVQGLIVDIKQPITKSWKDYPAGTLAHSASGGYWIKQESGKWLWPGGNSFGTPGGDAISVTLPLEVKKEQSILFPHLYLPEESINGETSIQDSI